MKVALIVDVDIDESLTADVVAQQLALTEAAEGTVTIELDQGVQFTAALLDVERVG